MAYDFLDANWPGTQNVLVDRALKAYHNLKTKGARDTLTSNITSDTASQIGVKRNIWQIDDPTGVRIKTKVVQKYTVYNTGSTIAYMTKIDAKAKRHLASTQVFNSIGDSTYSETAMPLLIVADEMTAVTPAGANCVVCWQPSRAVVNVPFQMPSGVTDIYGANNLFAQLRMWHARRQFMPWWHTKRQVQLIDTGTAAASRSLIDNGRHWMNYLAVPSSSAAPWGYPGAMAGSGAYPAADSRFANWNFTTAWRAFKTGGGPAGMEQKWGTTQAAAVPTAGAPTTEAFRLYPEYREQKKGIMDRWWRRRAQRLQPLLPGSSMSWKTHSRSVIAPWRMGIPGVAPGSADSYLAASNRWRAMAFDGLIANSGMGFDKAYTAGAGAPRGIMDQPSTVTANIYPHRFIYNKKTDPMGSPGTSGAFTLMLRGNTVPHVATAPAIASDFVDAGPAQVMIKRETWWAVKMYVKKARESNKPFMVENDAFYDATANPESGFLNFFKTSPAQAAPVTYAQI